MLLVCPNFESSVKFSLGKKNLEDDLCNAGGISLLTGKQAAYLMTLSGRKLWNLL